MLKKLLFCFQENPQVFISLYFHFFVFISSRFHFYSFTFFPVFILHVIVFLDVFTLDCICLLHCFFTVVVVIASATDLRDCLLLSDVFYLKLLPKIWHLLLSRYSWGRQFSLDDCRYQSLKHRFCPSVCLNHLVFDSYMISRKLYLNLSKYVDKLLVVKSLINFQHIN